MNQVHSQMSPPVSNHRDSQDPNCLGRGEKGKERPLGFGLKVTQKYLFFFFLFFFLTFNWGRLSRKLKLMKGNFKKLKVGKFSGFFPESLLESWNQFSDPPEDFNIYVPFSKAMSQPSNIRDGKFFSWKFSTLLKQLCFSYRVFWGKRPSVVHMKWSHPV